jgi:adenosine deaminase
MKHLRLFENITNEVFVVKYTNYEDSFYNFIKVFQDNKSAENFYFEYLNNKIAENIRFNENREIKDDEYIFSYDDALDFMQDDNFDLEIEALKVETYEMSDKLKLLMSANKYNL